MTTLAPPLTPLTPPGWPPARGFAHGDAAPLLPDVRGAHPACSGPAHT